MKIGIIVDKNFSDHSTIWNKPWMEFAKENNISYTILNPDDWDLIEKLKPVDVVLWHFSGYSFTEMLISKSILFSAKAMGKKIFPDFNDVWHFDDKVAETYLLQGINAPLPNSLMFYDMESVNNFLDSSKSKFPYVAKLRNGSGSHNVKMIQNKEELIKYAKIMFTKGFSSAPSLLYKTTSNIKSSKSIKTFINRVKKIPEFLRTLKNSKKFPNEKGYVYLQEFIPNNGYDLKIVVVGEKLSFIGRNIREGEFRASGGGDLFYDKSFVTQNVIDSAFRTSDEIGFKCMGYDYVVDKDSGKGIIIEISYGFSHEALLSAGGYFDRKGIWHAEPLNAPKELLKNIVSKIDE
ncbi:MAG: ATP-grasp domain-containing protein [Psychroflexus halocasei]